MACCCIDSTPMRRLRTGCSPVIGHLPPPAPVMSALCFTTPALKRRLSTDSEPQSAVLHARSCLFCQCWVRPPPPPSSFLFLSHFLPFRRLVCILSCLSSIFAILFVLFSRPVDLDSTAVSWVVAIDWSISQPLIRPRSSFFPVRLSFSAKP